MRDNGQKVPELLTFAPYSIEFHIYDRPDENYAGPAMPIKAELFFQFGRELDIELLQRLQRNRSIIPIVEAKFSGISKEECVYLYGIQGELIETKERIYMLYGARIYAIAAQHEGTEIVIHAQNVQVSKALMSKPSNSIFDKSGTMALDINNTENHVSINDVKFGSTPDNKETA
jgi:hypothetical protein